MKSILLPMDQSEQMPSALETAGLAAMLFGSTVEGFALRPAFTEVIAGDMAIAMPAHPVPTRQVSTRHCQNASFPAASPRQCPGVQ